MAQLQFWLTIQIANVFGDTIGEYLFRSPHAMQVAFLVMFNIFALAIIFALLNWLLARHVGRTFGGFGPASMSIRNVVGRRIFQPGQMAGANPAVRLIVWTRGIAQFRPYLNG
jgi:hypothetical protein